MTKRSLNARSRTTEQCDNYARKVHQGPDARNEIEIKTEV